MSQPQLLLLLPGCIVDLTLLFAHHPTANNCLVTPPTPQLPQSSYKFSQPFFNPMAGSPELQTDMMLSNRWGLLASFLS